MSLETVTIGEIPLMYEKEGSGPPLVFFHGGNASAVQWEAIVPHFIGEYTCYSLEQRGHGRSGRAPDADYRFGTMMEEGTAFVDRVTGPAILVGQSMGGGVALAVAANRPDLAKAVYMEDSVPSIYGARRNAGMPIQNFFEAVGTAAEARQRDGLSITEHAYNLGQLAPFGRKMADVWTPQALIFFARASCDTDPRWYAGGRKYALPDDLCDALPSRVQCPVHIAYGDPAVGGLVSEDDIRELLAAGMNLTSTHFPGAGHMIQPTFAREFVNDLRGFLARVS